MKLLDTLLFIYTLIFSAVVFTANITRISNTATAIPVLLFLPVLIHLAYESLMLYYRKRYAPPMPPQEKELKPTKPRFSLVRFIAQGGVSFSLSLVLFLLCLVTFASKAYLSSQKNPQFISPLPSNSTLQSYSNH